MQGTTTEAIKGDARRAYMGLRLVPFGMVVR